MLQPASVSVLPFTAFSGPVSELLRALFSCLQITVSSLVVIETRLINAGPAAQSMDKPSVPSVLPGQEAFLGKHGQTVSHVTQKGLFPPQLAGFMPEAEMKDTGKMG